MTAESGSGPMEGTGRSIPPETPAQTPRELDQAIELVRAAYSQALREQGVLPGVVLAITARAELLIHEVLEHADDDGD